jgi:hypothetical protein
MAHWFDRWASFAQGWANIENARACSCATRPLSRSAGGSRACNRGASTTKPAS